MIENCNFAEEKWVDDTRPNKRAYEGGLYYFRGSRIFGGKVFVFHCNCGSLGIRIIAESVSFRYKAGFCYPECHH